MFHKEPDGTIIDQDGKIIFFSCERFVRDICHGDCCFICGIDRNNAEFNDEHILPNWLLREHQLHGRQLILPNKTGFKYSQYTVPCCKSCNDMMGTLIENPIRNLLVQGSEQVNNYLVQNGMTARILITTWMALIFIKAHLKDRSLRFSRDMRVPDTPISGDYTWEELHHLHCIGRSFYTGCEISPEVLGSFYVFPASHEATKESFDWIDLTHSQTMFLRLGDVALLTVFNDSCGVIVKARHIIEKITGPLSFLQWRELTAEFAFLNFHILNRPAYRSEFNMQEGRSKILADLPSAGIELDNINLEMRGHILHHLLEGVLDNIHVDGFSQKEITQSIIAGTCTFLFDKDGGFITQSYVSSDGS